MKWYNEPPSWRIDGDTITTTTGENTDFWRETHYGFIRDNGHFYYETVQGDFVAEVVCSGRYEELYDQAGLMLRLDELEWVKAGIEFTGDAQCLSVVVTRTYSDWSLVPLHDSPGSVRWRLQRQGASIRVDYSVAGLPFQMLRLAYLPERESVDIGVMSCSPQREGFEARFTGFVVADLREPALYS